MKLGKIPGHCLQQLVLDKIGFKRKEVLVHAGLGEDSAVVDLGGELLVISSDPITGASKNAGYLAVHIACNDLAATGAEPLGLQTILLLPSYMTENDLERLMEEIVKTASSIGVEVLGGHTEILSIVSKPLIAVTAIGKVEKEKYDSSSGAEPGDEVIVTKGLGIEGTYILATEFEEDLLKAGISQDIIVSARKYGDRLSVINEGIIAAGLGVHAMHDITEGGFYGAVEEISLASGSGFEIYREKFPVNSETELICSALGIDPAGLISSGSMLIVAPDGKRVVDILKEKGIFSAVVGRMLKEGKYLIEADGKRNSFSWSKIG